MEKKRINNSTKIVLYILLGVLILSFLSNLGKPVVRDGGLAGVLRSLGLSGGGSRVTPCGGSGDALCADCVEKCGRTGFCIPSGKKRCAKYPKNCYDSSTECPCSSNAECLSCSEECKRNPFPPWNRRCVSTGKKECDDRRCIPEGESCCVGSEDYIPCGTSCCRKMYSETEEMQCCRKSTAAAGVCCKASNVCEQYDDAINFCKIPASDCNATTEFLCTATETGLAKCCPKTMGCNGKYLPTCTVKTCSEEKKCYDFGSGDILCCADKEVCIHYDIFYVCVKTGCKDDEFLCPGEGKDPPLEEFTECCKKDKEKCIVQPNGQPKCIPSLLGK